MPVPVVIRGTVAADNARHRAILKISLIILVCVFVPPVWGGAEEHRPSNQKKNDQETVVQQDSEDVPVNWVDDSHAYATDQVQALTEWMDNFFGDPNYELEKAESLVRVVWRNNWDEQDGYGAKVRLSGKLQLPKISKRLNLFFGGENGDELSNDEQKSEDRAGLLYTVDQRRRSRIDLTLGFSSVGFRPGVRFRHQGPLYDNSGYRFTQRVEYKENKGFYSTGELNLDHAFSDTDLLRLSNEVVYGENTQGTEWQSVVSLNQRRSVHKKDPRVFSYFALINGVTDPSYVKNYRLGVLFRRQLYRPFLFVELQPSYSFRKKNSDEHREGVWGVELNFEIALERDLRRMR